eukprot:jgi/Psemu1/46517/gm1.46517_g
MGIDPFRCSLSYYNNKQPILSHCKSLLVLCLPEAPSSSHGSSHLHWVVPYDVADDAGNKATTVYRDVKVEEIGLFGLEKNIREEVAREEQRKTKRSIDAAVRAERKKWEAEARANNNGNSNSRSCRDTASSCPACPVCDCPETDAIVNTTTCSAHCSDMSETCRKLGDDNFVYKLLLLLEDVFPVQLVPMIVLSFLVVGFLYALQWGNGVFTASELHAVAATLPGIQTTSTALLRSMRGL